MTFKQRLADKQLTIGTFQKVPHPHVCEALGQTDLDAVCLDAEHAPFDRKDLDQCIFALKASGTPAIVRPQSTTPDQILNALDLGADAILAPHIATRAAAEALVHSATYGRGRGFTGSARAAGYGKKTMSEHLKTSAARTTLIAQIEDLEALDNLDSIFTTQGIDAFFIGRADLTVAMGHTRADHSEVVSAVEAICKKGAETGVTLGMFTADLSEIPHWRDMGVSLFLLGSDMGFLKQGANHLYRSASESKTRLFK